MSLYFNNAFSKQPLSDCIDAMAPYLRDQFENPLTESYGAENVRGMVEEARKSISGLLNAFPQEIFFVSSGTEANNWAIKGAAQAQKKKNHLVISAIEHFSIFQTAQFLERNGFELTIAPVDSSGQVDIQAIQSAIRPSTFLVSILAGSDEIGVVQDLRAITRLKAHFEDVLFHTDAIQYLCYESIDVQRLPFDLVSLSSNALYGPSGIASLYIRQGTRMIPLLHGGMQEDGLRPGLQSSALIAGFGQAAAINLKKKQEWKRELAALQSMLITMLDQMNTPLTGDRRNRLVDNVHGIVDVDGEALLTLLSESGIQASTGSTCYQYAQKESHVLQAIGIDKTRSRGAILFTLGIDQTKKDIDCLQEEFSSALVHLRRLKPGN